MSNLVLSLFPGIGLLDRAFEEHGFCVVRGPDVLWGGDIHTFHPPPGVFGGVIGGPPCQCFSRLSAMVLHNQKFAAPGKYQLAPNLIPQFERVVIEAAPRWFVMENVPEAPEPNTPGFAVQSLLLNNRWFGGVQHRQRRFSIGVRGGQAINLIKYLEVEAFEPLEWEPAVLAAGARRGQVRLNPGGKEKRINKGSARARTVLDAIRLQGLPDGFLDKAPFTVEGKQRVIGNGVPLPLGRGIAKAIRAYIEANL